MYTDTLICADLCHSSGQKVKYYKKISIFKGNLLIHINLVYSDILICAEIYHSSGQKVKYCREISIYKKKFTDIY